MGVDAGGTWLRLAGMDSSGRTLLRLRWRTADSLAPAALLRRVLPRRGLRPRGLVLGCRGVWLERERERAAASLLGLAETVSVLPDVELAWIASLGGKPGVLILAGTGSIAYGRDACGHQARAGGLGPLLGDEGSAFWIGRAWLGLQDESARLRHAHGADPVRAVSKLALRALKEAERGDLRARGILGDARRHLRAQAENAASGLHFRDKVPLSWQGGLFGNAPFRKAFLRLLSRSKIEWDPRPPGLAPAVAAAHLARLGKLPPDGLP